MKLILLGVAAGAIVAAVVVFLTTASSTTIIGPTSSVTVSWPAAPHLSPWGVPVGVLAPTATRGDRGIPGRSPVTIPIVP